MKQRKDSLSQNRMNYTVISSPRAPPLSVNLARTRLLQSLISCETDETLMPSPVGQITVQKCCHIVLFLARYTVDRSTKSCKLLPCWILVYLGKKKKKKNCWWRRFHIRRICNRFLPVIGECFKSGGDKVFVLSCGRADTNLMVIDDSVEEERERGRECMGH